MNLILFVLFVLGSALGIAAIVCGCLWLLGYRIDTYDP